MSSKATYELAPDCEEGTNCKEEEDSRCSVLISSLDSCKNRLYSSTSSVKAGDVCRIIAGLVFVALLIAGLVALIVHAMKDDGGFNFPCKTDADCDADRGFICNAKGNCTCGAVLDDKGRRIRVIGRRCMVVVSESNFKLENFCGSRVGVGENGTVYTIRYECASGEKRTCWDEKCSCKTGYRESTHSSFCFKNERDTKKNCTNDLDCIDPEKHACISNTCRYCVLGDFEDKWKGKYACIPKEGKHCRRVARLFEVGREDDGDVSFQLVAMPCRDSSTGMYCPNGTDEEFCECRDRNKRYNPLAQQCIWKAAALPYPPVWTSYDHAGQAVAFPPSPREFGGHN